MRELMVARKAAEAGGEIVARYFREGVEMRSKESYNLVSDADLESEKAIGRVIREAFPDHSILGEETHQAETDCEHLWIVDPLDGTNNFAHRLPHFAISVAYYEQGQARCGIVFNPLRDDWYEAADDGLARHNGHDVNVENAQRLDQVLVGVGFYYDRGAMMECTLAAIGDLFRQKIHGIRRFGTASLDLCQVGTGQFGGFFEYELSPWDYAAGRLFVEQAGGRVTTARGEPLSLKKTSLLASNGQLHDSLLAIVAAHHPAT